jgi:hypothetical protein
MPHQPAGRDATGQVRVAVVLVLLVLLPLGFSVADRVFFGNQASVEAFLEPPETTETQCIRDTAYMRYRHWELLRGVREEVVRYGIRGDITIDSCRSCHKSRERFCNRCHDATSLTPDCFECHYYP